MSKTTELPPPLADVAMATVPHDILISFRWTADELLAAYRWHFRNRIRAAFRWAFWFLIAIFIIGGASQVILYGSSSGGLPIFYAGIYLVFHFQLLRPWLVRRQFAKRPDRDAMIEWHIAEDLIQVRGAHGRSEFVWAALVKVVQTPAGFLFYPTEHIFHWLPRHGFSNDADFDNVARVAHARAAAFHLCDR